MDDFTIFTSLFWYIVGCITFQFAVTIIVITIIVIKCNKIKKQYENEDSSFIGDIPEN